MAKSWWHDPSYDPMQDLADCKHNLQLMAPALRQHAEVIEQLMQQNDVLNRAVNTHKLEIALLCKQVIDLRKQVIVANNQGVCRELR
jgi:hypothetical protein